MKPYKGIVRISCTKEASKTCPQGIRENVRARCLGCAEARLEILNFLEEVLYCQQPLEEKIPKITPKKTKKLTL